MEQMEQNNQRNGYWSGLLSGLLLAILLLGGIYLGKQVFQIFEEFPLTMRIFSPTSMY